MDTKVIFKINNVEILATSDEQFIPIRPICSALGIDFSRQLRKLKEDKCLSSLLFKTPSTGADGKCYNMVCLPSEFIYGWLFTINPKNVKPEAKDKVLRNRIECYKVLYKYLHRQKY